MLQAAGRHLLPLHVSQAGEGDVLIFRMRAGCVAKHAAIVSGAAAMIHAMEGGAACEVPLSPWWRRRIAGAFAFPSSG
jgi:NlpC/P60 family putative phage cell wall peptidase